MSSFLAFIIPKSDVIVGDLSIVGQGGAVNVARVLQPIAPMDAVNKDDGRPEVLDSSEEFRKVESNAH